MSAAHPGCHATRHHAEAVAGSACAAGAPVGEAGVEGLFSRYRRTRDRALRNELIERHRWLAATIARRYADRGEPVEDLEQVGLLGLLRTVERYDPAVGPFVSYARVSISGEIGRHFRDRTWSAYVPRPVKDLEQRLAPAIESLSHDLGRSPRPAELADRLGVDVDAVLAAMQSRNAYKAGSLDGIGARAGSRPSATPDHADAVVDGVFLDRLLGGLDQRNRRIVELRYVDGLSQAEIGRRTGISQVQVSRVLGRSLVQLRGELEASASPARAGTSA